MYMHTRARVALLHTGLSAKLGVMAEIERLVEADAESLSDINSLIHQLSLRLTECSMDLFKKIIGDQNHELWVVRDGKKIVGMATLAIVIIPEGERAQIEDVVVDETYRGQGLGEQLSKKLIERARARNIPKITLSSRADRAAANSLYQKLGFTQWPTNVYHMKL